MIGYLEEIIYAYYGRIFTIDMVYYMVCHIKFMFVLSSLKLPSVTGSCSHPCGNGLGAALFGPAVTAVLATIVLLFQAILLAHGGLTTLGANIFSMGIVGPLAAWLIYKGLTKANVSSTIAIFFAAFLGDLLT